MVKGINMLRKNRRIIPLGLGLLCCLMSLIGSAFALDPVVVRSERGSGWETYKAESGAYTVRIPKAWKLTWLGDPTGREPSELQLASPGEPRPEHTTISILHYARVHQTPERYLFDLQHLFIGGKDEVRSTVMDVMVAGIPAKAMDVSTNRYPPLGMTGEKTPAFIRYVVVPARQGFFVLRYDVPERLAIAHRGMFDLVVESFVPADRGLPSTQDQIPANEYEIYEAFFNAQPPKGPNPPQFFDDALKCRLVDGETLSLDKPLSPVLLKEEFDVADPALVNDYLAKNQKVWQLTDRIMVQSLQVLPSEELKARLSAFLRRPAGREAKPSFLDQGIVTLSRVGFNATGNFALFSVAMTYPGTMRARYVVLMHKKGGAWSFVKVTMDDLIYH